MSLVQSLGAPQPIDPTFTPPPLDSSELMPTAPHRAPPVDPRPRRTDIPKTAQTKSPAFVFKPWMAIAALVVVALIIALIVAMSGPNVQAGK